MEQFRYHEKWYKYYSKHILCKSLRKLLFIVQHGLMLSLMTFQYHQLFRTIHFLICVKFDAIMCKCLFNLCTCIVVSCVCLVVMMCMYVLSCVSLSQGRTALLTDLRLILKSIQASSRGVQGVQMTPQELVSYKKSCLSVAMD